MKPIQKVASAVVLAFIIVSQSAFATDSTHADDACYHNVIRDALNNGKTMYNLWEKLEQRSYNFANEIRPNPPLPFLSNDSALKNSSKAWASRCIWRHSPKEDRQGLGENIYWITEKSGTTANQWVEARNGTIERAVNTWSYEAAFYSFSSNSCQSGEQCGHYTQIVWNDAIMSKPTTRVGCVAQFCPNGLEDTSSYLSRPASYVVCHYTPPGNYPIVPYSGQSKSSSSGAAPISGCRDGLGAAGGSGFLPSIMLLLND